MSNTDTSPPSQTLRLRLYHDYERPRNGREVFLQLADFKNISHSSILSALSPTVDFTRFIPHFYCLDCESFLPISPTTSCLPTPPSHPPFRLDIKLVSKITPPAPADSLLCDSSLTSLTGTWFGIGIIRGKSASNHGTLWRSALQFGASLTFTIGRRYTKKTEGSADIYKTYRQVPCLGFADVSTFMNSLPIDAKVVVVEYGGEDLLSFQHPKRALYILGSEDSGVPPALVQKAHAHIQIPTMEGRPSSLNVAAAGSIVMYDRLTKEQKSQQSWGLRGPSGQTTSETQD